MIGISRMRGISSRSNTSQRTNRMNDRIWTTDEGETVREIISDDDARSLLQEQLRRRIETIQRYERERLRQERIAEEERKNNAIGFLQDFLDGKMPAKKKEKILKPLPDELFEI